MAQRQSGGGSPFGTVVRGTLLAFAATAMAFAAAGIVRATEAMRLSFPGPGWPHSPQVPFVDQHLPDAMAWWHVVAGWETLWSVALVVGVLALLRLPHSQRGIAAACIVAMQIVLLALACSVRIPFNAGQYLYVAYADLVVEGANPYDPPARSAVRSPQLLAIGTVWGTQAEGNTNPPTRIVMRDRYGPAYTLGVAAALAPFRNAGVETQALVVRVLSAAALVGCALLLWMLLPATGWSCAALAAVALNPVVVMQSGMGAHNDVIALLFALAACAAAARGRYGIAGVAAALSVATKITFAPFLLPFVVAAWVARGARGAALAAGAFAATAIAVALPFGVGRAYVQAAADARAYNFSYLVTLAQAAARHVHVVPPSAMWLFSAAYVGALGAASIALAIATARRRSAPVLAAALLLLIFCGSKFLPWYAIALAPLVLVRARWALGVFLGLSLAAQIFDRTAFTGAIDDLPFATFVALAAVGTVGFLGLRHWVERGAPVRLPGLHETPGGGQGSLGSAGPG